MLCPGALLQGSASATQTHAAAHGAAFGLSQRRSLCASRQQAFAKQLVTEYTLGPDAARFAVVSFAEAATLRTPWTSNRTAIEEERVEGASW